MGNMPVKWSKYLDLNFTLSGCSQLKWSQSSFQFCNTSIWSAKKKKKKAKFFRNSKDRRGKYLSSLSWDFCFGVPFCTFVQGSLLEGTTPISLGKGVPCPKEDYLFLGSWIVSPAMSLLSSSPFHYQHSIKHFLKNRLLAISQKNNPWHLVYRIQLHMTYLHFSWRIFNAFITVFDYRVYQNEWCQHPRLSPKYCGTQETTETIINRENPLLKLIKFLSCHLGIWDFRVGELIQKIAQLFILPQFYGVKVMQTALVTSLLLW